MPAWGGHLSGKSAEIQGYSHAFHLGKEEEVNIAERPPAVGTGVRSVWENGRHQLEGPLMKLSSAGSTREGWRLPGKNEREGAGRSVQNDAHNVWNGEGRREAGNGCDGNAGSGA